MSTVRFPGPLAPGDKVGVTGPSMGIGAWDKSGLERAVAAVRGRGYEVVMGACLDGSSHVSAPAADRAAELTQMLTEPAIRAVVPPRGGETAIDLLPLLDWAAIAAAEPTWFAGFSDISTLLLPMTLATGVATLHSNNLLNTPYGHGGQAVTWLDIVAMRPGAVFTQSYPARSRASAGVTAAAGAHNGNGLRPRSVGARLRDGDTAWVRLDGDGPVDVTGRLIGGCVETVRHLAGTPYGDIPRFSRERAADGLIVYLEASGDDAYAVCRSLHGMRLAGFFTGARAVLVGATIAPDAATMTQQEAVLDALSGLGVPIIADVGCGHVPPYLPIVNGALGRVQLGAGLGALTQTLG
jgi:muramoyltetrapeptide carboxypeptidase